MKRFRHTSLGFVLGVLSACFLLGGCAGGPEEGGAPAVAVVAGQPITAAEFQIDYELGFAHLKRGEDPRRAYLDRMIDERLLALEGYRLGLADEPEVRDAVERLRERRLVEAAFEAEVNDAVSVSEAEWRRALAEASVQFKLRCLPSPSRPAAERDRAAIAADGFASVVRSRWETTAVPPLRPEDFESGYLSGHDVAPEILEAVRDLPMETPSEPIPYRGSFLVCEVVDVRREAVPAEPDEATRAHYREVVFRRKAQERTRRFIQEEMAPLDVRLHGSTFGPIRQVLWNWLRSAQPEGNLFEALAADEAPTADSLRAWLPEVLFRTREHPWTVESFLRHYPADRYPLSLENPEAFESDLYDAVGLLLRDRRLVEIAEAKALDEAESFRADLERWEEKWVYRLRRRQVLDSLGVDGEAHPAEARDAVRRYVARLRERTPVTVDEAVLAGVDVGPASGPPFTVVEAHSGLPAYPVVDPNW